MEIAGSRTLVLGGSGVLGGLVAAELVERGGRVALAGRDAGRLAAAAERAGGAPALRLDLTSPAAAAQVVEWAVAELGGIDGVVNASGVVAFGPLAEMDPSTVTELITTDLTAPLLVMAEAIPQMDGGFFVNLSGVVAEQPFPGMAAYVAAKAGLSAATRALAKELRRERILAIDARPPHTETGLADRAIAGTAPRFPEGLAPETVARRVVAAIEADEREIPAADFA